MIKLNKKKMIDKKFWPVLQKKYKAFFDYLENSRSIDINKAVELAYSYADTYYTADIKNDAVCRGKGCNWCCHIPANLSAIEAVYIANKTGLTPKMVGQRLPILIEPDKTPCPFLKNGSCSIYEYRPLNCRVFASLDSVEFCKDGSIPHAITTTNAHKSLESIEANFAKLSVETRDQLNLPVVSDIRAYFGEAKNGYTPDWAKKENRIL